MAHHNIVVFESGRRFYFYAETLSESCGIVYERSIVACGQAAIAVLRVYNYIVAVHIEKHIDYTASVVHDVLHVHGIAPVSAAGIDTIPIHFESHSVNTRFRGRGNGKCGHGQGFAAVACQRSPGCGVQSFLVGCIVCRIGNGFA